jgi:competence protein ComEA
MPARTQHVDYGDHIMTDNDLIFTPARFARACRRLLAPPRGGTRFAAALALALAAGLGALSSPLQARDEAPPTAATVNINVADAATLAAALNGVGLSRAEEIVRYREAYGPFSSVEELAEVKGIGESTLEKNRTVITLD